MVLGCVDILIIRPASPNRFLERAAPTGRRRARVEIDHLWAGWFGRGLFESVTEFLPD